MPVTPDPIIWHKLNAAVASELGPSPTFNGDVTFSPAKFGNGLDMSHACNVDWGYITIGSVQSSWSFWAKMGFNSSDGSYHILDDNYSIPQMTWLWMPSGNDMIMWFFTTNSTPSAGAYYHIQCNNFSAGDLVHWGLCLDPTQPNKIRLFQNNVELTITSRIYDGVWTDTGYYVTLPNPPDETASPPDIVFDNFKLYNYAKTDFTWDMANEGLESASPPPPPPPPPPSPPQLVYEIPAIKNPQILINGFDVYKAGLIAKLFNVTEEKAFKISKLIFNDFTLDAKNFDNVFSRDNPKSIFYSKNLYLPVQIYNRDGKLIFTGVMLNLSRDHVAKTASIEISDTMATFTRTKIQYQTTSGINQGGQYFETPAQAVKNLMDKYGASAYYDINSINISDAIYKLNGAYISCDVKLNANTYLTNFIEKLAEIGCADAYIHNNLIRFEHWQLFTKPPSSVVNVDIDALSKSIPLSAPKISILFNEIVNDYRIRYVGDSGTPITDATANNIGALSRNNLAVYSLPEIRTTETAQVSTMNKQAAIYFGECLIRRTHTNLATNPNPLQVIEFDLPIQDREWIDITSHFSLTFSEEGWNQKLFEVMKITFDDDANMIKLTAYEVSS